MQYTPSALSQYIGLWPIVIIHGRNLRFSGDAASYKFITWKHIISQHVSSALPLNDWKLFDLQEFEAENVALNLEENHSYTEDLRHCADKYSTVANLQVFNQKVILLNNLFDSII